MHALSSYSLGLVFIVIVAVIWAAASILVQYLYDDQHFDSPFLLTYIGTSLFTLLLPTQCIYQWIFRFQPRLHHRDTSDYETLSSVHPPTPTPTPTPPSTSTTTTTTTTTSNDETQNTHSTAATTIPTTNPSNRKWTTQDHIRAAAKIAPVWFVSNYAYNASLKFTSITSSTVLASTGSLFTFLLALVCRDEHFSLWKFVGVGLGMAGSILTGLHDVHPNTASDSASDSASLSASASVASTEAGDDERLWGDALGLLSAVGYGAYAIMVRVLCPHDESLMSMQLFLGYVGLWNMVFLSPIAIYQVSSQLLSNNNNPSLTWLVFGFLIVKGLLDNVLSDYLWARAVVLTSATVATVGLGLTIPLAFMSDVLLGRPDVLDAFAIGGALAVLVGFLLVNVGQQQEQAQQQQQNDIAEQEDLQPPEMEQHHQSYHQSHQQQQQQEQQQARGPLVTQDRLHMSMDEYTTTTTAQESTTEIS